MASSSVLSNVRKRLRSRAERLEAQHRPQPDYQAVPRDESRERNHVPWAVDTAAAWSWRLLVISAAVLALLMLVNRFMVILLPIIIAMFLAALVRPFVDLLDRVLPRKVSSLVAVIGMIALVSGIITFVSHQVATGFAQLSDQVVTGLGQIRDWLRTGPLHLSDHQLQSMLNSIQETIKGKNGHIITAVGEVGTTLSHVVAGIFIVLFATYFFLADGERIWAWVVRLFPRVARPRADSSGRVAWTSLTQFVRATVIVAATDAAATMLGAACLGVPLISAIGALVFLGAFVPMVGAFVSGTAAVLVALVSVGFAKALVMLGVVIAVQQMEAHALQPFLMGRFVSVHPLGVIVAIGVGVLAAGITGALLAVPLTAALNAVGQHLAQNTRLGESVDESIARDPDPGQRQPYEPDGDHEGTEGVHDGVAATAPATGYAEGTEGSS